MFHPENGRLLSKSAVFALRTYASLVVGGLQGGHGKPNLRMGAVPALCVCYAETLPKGPQRGLGWAGSGFLGKMLQILRDCPFHRNTASLFTWTQTLSTS